jgi:hypothetical protein
VPRIKANSATSRAPNFQKAACAGMCTAAPQIKLALYAENPNQVCLRAKSKERLSEQQASKQEHIHITSTQTHVCESPTPARVTAIRGTHTTPRTLHPSSLCGRESGALFAVVSSFMQAGSANQIGNVNKGGNCAQCSGVSDCETIHRAAAAPAPRERVNANASANAASMEKQRRGSGASNFARPLSRSCCKTLPAAAIAPKVCEIRANVNHAQCFRNFRHTLKLLSFLYALACKK